jgi:hypothetical protein
MLRDQVGVQNVGTLAAVVLNTVAQSSGRRAECWHTRCRGSGYVAVL